MQELYQKSQGLTVVEEISARNLGALTEAGVGVIPAAELTDAHYTFCIHTLEVGGTEFQV